MCITNTRQKARLIPALTSKTKMASESPAAFSCWKMIIVKAETAAIKKERVRVILLSSFLEIGPANKKAKAERPETD